MWPSHDPGRLRHEITIVRPVIDADGARGKPEEIATVRAEYIPVSGREVYRLRQTNAEVQCAWRIYYLDGLNSSMQVQFRGKVFEMVAPPEDEGNLSQHWLLLACREINQ